MVRKRREQNMTQRPFHAHHHIKTKQELYLRYNIEFFATLY